MTIEKRIVVGLADIVTITLECRECGARLSASPDKFIIPAKCPHCPQEWISGEQRSFQSESSQQRNFVDAVRKLRSEEPKHSAFRILLEFEAPAEKP